MSYTIPDYVDTKEQAVLAVASAIKGEAVTGGDGSVNRALDILADVLAEQDVSVPQTNAGAILALAQYASGMVKPEGTIAITENGEGIDVSQYATADVSVSGGGGGDLSTATLTIVNQSEAALFAHAPNALDVDGGSFARASVYAEPGTSEVEVILYKGRADFQFNDSIAATSVSVTGDVETCSSLFDPSYVDGLTITGDGTVTIAA